MVLQRYDKDHRMRGEHILSKNADWSVSSSSGDAGRPCPPSVKTRQDGGGTRLRRRQREAKFGVTESRFGDDQ